MRGKKVSFRRFSQFKLTDFILSCLIFRVDGIQNEFLCGRMPGLDGLVVSNGNLNIDSRFHGDGTGDLADSITGGVQVNDTLVDTHLELVPSLGTFSARSLTGGDSELLGRHSNGSLHLRFILCLILGTLNKISADLLQSLEVAGVEGNSDSQDLGIILRLLSILVDRHFVAEIIRAELLVIQKR